MKIKNLVKLFRHRKEARMLLEALLFRIDGQIEFGSLTDEEVAGLTGWIKDVASRGESPLRVAEIGTLFGSTARKLARVENTRLTTVDNFSWNPFGLDPETHERFTRHLLSGTGIDVAKADSVEFLKKGRYDFVFLDGAHDYDSVKAEILAILESQATHVSGHDWGDERFGVTKAVMETIGVPDKIAGRCWYKELSRR